MLNIEPYDYFIRIRNFQNTLINTTGVSSSVTNFTVMVQRYVIVNGERRVLEIIMWKP